MTTNAGRRLLIVLVATFTLALSLQVTAQDGNKNKPAAPVGDLSSTPQEQSRASDGTRPAETLSFIPAPDAVVVGVVLRREADSFTLRDRWGRIVTVNLTHNTEVKEKKSNPFREARKYSSTQLVRGLEVEVRGHGNTSGALVANEIRFTNDNLRAASLIETRVQPVEGRLSENEARLGQTEENAQRLSGQLAELSAVSNTARSGARAAQETADTALESARTAHEAANGAKAAVRIANERISALDSFDVKTDVAVTFSAGSAVLSKEARASLDKLAEEAKGERGFVIEVAGFASSDGSAAVNEALSQRRADAVIRYLAENHMIPLRRFITPFGYGERQPIADNKTHAGRMQNRRVEVRILVNKGLAQSTS